MLNLDVNPLESQLILLLRLDHQTILQHQDFATQSENELGIENIEVDLHFIIEQKSARNEHLHELPIDNQGYKPFFEEHQFSSGLQSLNFQLVDLHFPLLFAGDCRDALPVIFKKRRGLFVIDHHNTASGVILLHQNTSSINILLHNDTPLGDVLINVAVRVMVGWDAPDLVAHRLSYIPPFAVHETHAVLVFSPRFAVGRLIHTVLEFLQLNIVVLE